MASTPEYRQPEPASRSSPGRSILDAHPSDVPALPFDGTSDAVSAPESSKPLPSKPLVTEQETPEDPSLSKPRIAVLLTKLTHEENAFMEMHKTPRDRILPWAR
ncbi:hypothetical protein G6514_010406 [Epicoccum nigrum]|nr:hypothetical protein G6514_010406 [Epicoccum nigrum]